MKIDNKIEHVFGRTAIFVGVIFLLVAVLFLVFDAVVPGVLAQILSIFVIFTYSGVEIETKQRRVRQYNKLFGIIKTGRWKSVNAFLGITLVPFTKTESMASWSNRITSVKSTDYRIYLVNKARRPAFAIKRCATPEEAYNSLDEFSIWLKLPVYSVKRGG